MVTQLNVANRLCLLYIQMITRFFWWVSLMGLYSSEVIRKVPNRQRIIYILASLGINTEDKVWFTEKHNTVNK